MSHCPITLGPGEMAPCAVDSQSINTYLPTGNYRGVIVLMHGISDGPNPIPPTIYFGDTSTDHTYHFIQNVTADGWIVLQVPYPEDYYSPATGVHGIFNSINLDPFHGFTYLLHTTFLWWDHVVAYIQQVYGNVPIIPYGQSWGAWHTIQIAIGRTSTISAYMAFEPACILENALYLFTGGALFYTIDCSGVYISPTALNSIILPGIVGYGLADEAVGYGATTFAGTNGQDVTTLPGGVLQVASVADMWVPGASVRVTTSNGYVTVSPTGHATGQLTGCTVLHGNGTIASGAAVVQNNTKALIANQNAAQPLHAIAGYPSASAHEISLDDANYYSNWLAGYHSTFPAIYTQ